MAGCIHVTSFNVQYPVVNIKLMTLFLGHNTHKIDWDNVKVLEKETKDFPWKVLEAIHIRKKGPNVNREKGLDLVQSGTTL